MKNAVFLLVGLFIPFLIFEEAVGAPDELITLVECMKGFTGVPDKIKAVISQCENKHSHSKQCFRQCLHEALGYFKMNKNGAVTGINYAYMKQTNEPLFSDPKSTQYKLKAFTTCYKSRYPRGFKMSGSCRQLKSFDNCYLGKLKLKCTNKPASKQARATEIAKKGGKKGGLLSGILIPGIL